MPVVGAKPSRRGAPWLATGGHPESGTVTEAGPLSETVTVTVEVRSCHNVPSTRLHWQRRHGDGRAEFECPGRPATVTAVLGLSEIRVQRSRPLGPIARVGFGASEIHGRVTAAAVFKLS